MSKTLQRREKWQRTFSLENFTNFTLAQSRRNFDFEIFRTPRGNIWSFFFVASCESHYHYQDRNSFSKVFSLHTHAPCTVTLFTHAFSFSIRFFSRVSTYTSYVYLSSFSSRSSPTLRIHESRRLLFLAFFTLNAPFRSLPRVPFDLRVFTSSPRTIISPRAFPFFFYLFIFFVQSLMDFPHEYVVCVRELFYSYVEPGQRCVFHFSQPTRFIVEIFYFFVTFFKLNFFIFFSFKLIEKR